MLPTADVRLRDGWLVCPVCKGLLRSAPGVLSCVGCARTWPQRERFADLIAEESPSSPDRAWAQRQHLMTAAYDELVADPAHTRLAYHNDFGSFVPLLARYTGRILDVGGGNGLVRHFLPGGADYVSLDPSPDWLADSWQAVAGDFPCLREPLQFVRGLAEQIPFADGFFDGALSFWSLNHCVAPERMLAEIARVLRPGGRFLLVLDEVEPPWRDVLDQTYRDHRSWSRPRLAWEKTKALWLGWPLEPDHLRIRESDLEEWTRETLRPLSRGWHGSYLTIEWTRPLT